MVRTVSRLLADSLEAHDIDIIYCVPGESYLGLTDALADKNSIQLVVCPARGRGGVHGGGRRTAARPGGRGGGVAPAGLANAMVAVHSSFHDATPLVLLVGQVERKDFGRLALQEQNYSRLLSDITKLVIEVNEPETASEAIARAFHVAESGLPGPVAVILPEDLFDETTDAPVDLPRPKVHAGPRAEDLDRLTMRAASERPLVYVGARWPPMRWRTPGVR